MGLSSWMAGESQADIGGIVRDFLPIGRAALAIPQLFWGSGWKLFAYWNWLVPWHGQGHIQFRTIPVCFRMLTWCSTWWHDGTSALEFGIAFICIGSRICLRLHRMSGSPLSALDFGSVFACIGSRARLWRYWTSDLHASALDLELAFVCLDLGIAFVCIGSRTGLGRLHGLPS